MWRRHLRASDMTPEEKFADICGPCTCEAKYSIEPHGKGYALYHGRCRHRHGHNLINMVEPASNFDQEHLTKLLNLGADEYRKDPDSGHVAE